MFGYIFKALAIMGVIAAWSDKALADGKVTAEEAVELLIQMAGTLGLPLSFSVPQIAQVLTAKLPPPTEKQ